MAQIPNVLLQDSWSEDLKQSGLNLLSQGKVRDTWRLSNDYLLVIATDRISIFDFVLNALIPKKGEVLTALTHFWLTQVLTNCEHHLAHSVEYDDFNVAADLKHDTYAGLELPNLPAERCLVVKDLTKFMYNFEMIFRHHIGGSVYEKYLETGTAGGQALPPNLPKWSKL
jgi:phosphoribosylaminoimidazole-succinocarboxamide synthase